MTKTITRKQNKRITQDKAQTNERNRKQYSVNK